MSTNPMEESELDCAIVRLVADSGVILYYIESRQNDNKVTIFK